MTCGSRSLNDMDALPRRLEVNGFAVVADVIDDVTCEVLASHLQPFGTIGVGSRALLV